MATRGRPIDETTRRMILRLARSLSIRRTAREVGLSPTTVWKYRKFSRL